MLPPRPRKRQEGNPRPLWAFRPPAHVQRYVEDQESENNLERSGIIVEMMETQMEMRAQLGELWLEVERTALMERSTLGAVLARLVRVGLKKK